VLGTKRTLEEGVNTHAYYIARAAVNLTEATTKEKIREALTKSSDTKAGVSVAAVLVNFNRGKKGLKGYSGPKMAVAEEKFIKKQENTRNYLRAGWIPAVKRLAPYSKSKSGAMARPAGGVLLRKSGTKGGATPAFGTWFPKATIWNAINGAKNKPNPNLKAKINQGAEDAIRHETEHINERIAKKIEERIKRFNSR
jgi:hypothetical protein